MRLLIPSIFFLVFNHALNAAEVTSDWQAQFDELSGLQGSEDAKNAVLGELALWAPDQARSNFELPLWFVDAYAEDETFRLLVDSYFPAAFTENCYEMITGETLGCPLEAIAHASGIGFEVLRLAQKAPLLLSSEYRSSILANFSLCNATKTCTALLSHWCAIAGYACENSSAGAYIGDPLGYVAALATGKIFKAASLIFASATAYLAMEGEYMDLVLRALKRKYEMQNRHNEVAVVTMMIGHRNQR